MSLSPSQKAFATSREPFPAFVGGYGSGKTAAAIARAMALKAHFRSCDIAYYLPTYPLVADIAFKRFPELCECKGWAFKLNKSSAVIQFPNAGSIIFRTMEHPERIIGYEVAHSILDELDTLPLEKASDVWNRVIARNRQKMPGGFPNTVAVATTPEGFRFVYERWAKNPAPGYVLFRAKTSDNAANLPDGYIDNLRNTYPPNLLQAYLDGEFVNLTSGAVYPDFNRQAAHRTADVQAGEPLHVGMDFNVMNMTAVVFVVRDDAPHAVAEWTGVRDTPAMCELLRQHYAGHSIVVYPDASGSSRKSVNAQESDHALLRQAGFTVRVNPTNPAVRDRINAVNAVMPRWRIDTDRCPRLVEALEQQVYDRNGEPDKTAGHDHPADAAGYFIAHRWPIKRRAVAVSALRI